MRNQSIEVKASHMRLKDSIAASLRGLRNQNNFTTLNQSARRNKPLNFEELDDKKLTDVKRDHASMMLPALDRSKINQSLTTDNSKLSMLSPKA